MSSCVVFEAFGLLPNIVIYPNIIFIFYFNFFFWMGENMEMVHVTLFPSVLLIRLISDKKELQELANHLLLNYKK